MAMAENTSIAVALLIGLVLFYIVIIGLAIAEYVLAALGLYRVAARRQVSSPIMAWFPVVNDLLLGKIIEQYDESNGHKRKWSNVLLILNLITISCGVVFFVGYFIFIFSVFMNVASMDMNAELFTFPVVGFILLMIAIILLSLASVAYTVCKYVAIYKLIESAEPVKTIKHFLLSMMVPLAYGIILLKYVKRYDQEIQPQTLELEHEEYKIEE